MKKTFLALMVSAAALAGLSAPASAQPRQQCLRVNQIDSFTPVRGDLRSMVVIDRFRNRYKVSFNTVCDDIDYNLAVAIRTLGSRLSCVTRGDVVISRNAAGWRDRCVITRVQPYTAAMERADREMARDSYRR